MREYAAFAVERHVLAAQHHAEHQVCLLRDLTPIQRHGMKMEQQRQLPARHVGAQPARLVEEARILRVHVACGVKRQMHGIGRSRKSGELLVRHRQCRRRLRVQLGHAAHRLHRAPQMLLRHPVGVPIVVDQRGVLVRASHPAEVEGVVLPVAQHQPKSRGLDQHARAMLDQERLVAGGVDV